MTDLPPSAAKFRAAAARQGLDVEVVVTAQPARTAEEAALACGCEVGQIVKSLVFRGAESGAPLLLLVSGRNRVDEARAAAAAGEPIGRPDAAFVRDATGFAIGGIPPLGHDRPVRTFIDAALLAYPLSGLRQARPTRSSPSIRRGCAKRPKRESSRSNDQAKERPRRLWRQLRGRNIFQASCGTDPWRQA